MNHYGIIDPRQGSSTPPSWYKDECDLFDFLMKFNDQPFVCEDERDNHLLDAITYFNLRYDTSFPADYTTLREFTLWNDRKVKT